MYKPLDTVKPIGPYDVIIGMLPDERDERANWNGTEFGLALLTNNRRYPSEFLRTAIAGGRAAAAPGRALRRLLPHGLGRVLGDGPVLEAHGQRLGRIGRPLRQAPVPQEILEVEQEFLQA